MFNSFSVHMRSNKCLQSARIICIHNIDCKSDFAGTFWILALEIYVISERVCRPILQTESCTYITHTLHVCNGQGYIFQRQLANIKYSWLQTFSSQLFRHPTLLYIPSEDRFYQSTCLFRMFSAVRRKATRIESRGKLEQVAG